MQVSRRPHDTNVRFAFGANWRRFNAALSEGQRFEARESLRDWFGDLHGKTFLDVGAGSGLFASAAEQLGAEVRAFDYDPASPEIERGDVLDRPFMESLGRFDIVYSWGVLHHTGAMWRAVANTLDRVKPGGLALIALYTKPARSFEIPMKRAYNSSPRSARAMIRGGWAAMKIVGRLRHHENPIQFVREYPANHRGMTFWRDVEDWVGGWPFEYTDAATFKARLPEGYGFERVREARPGGCSEYLIRRRRARCSGAEGFAA